MNGLRVRTNDRKSQQFEFRFVNNAELHSQTNLRAVRIKHEIYYVARKDIRPGFELLVWYGDEYADKLGCVDDGEEGEPRGPLRGVYKCEKCQMTYSCVMYINKHRCSRIEEDEEVNEGFWIFEWCTCQKHSEMVEGNSYRIKIPAKKTRESEGRLKSAKRKKVFVRKSEWRLNFNHST